MSTPPDGQKQPLALLLDDNLMSAVRLQRQLQEAGYQVTTARAVPRPEEAAPDRCLTDIAQPQLIIINLGSRSLDGVLLIGACRERYPAARIIGVCGHLEIEIRRAAKAAGIHKILTNEQAFSQLRESL
ncbi:MAG TPA: response regulator [Abditibacteriaceae bacterium]|nr:response regulator [Abditibacteriaceae bacterium]